MTEFLQHQSSIAYYDENRSGCMWGLFHLLDHKRDDANSRKLLAYRRHEDGELGRETRVPTSRPKVLKRSLEKEVNYQEDQASKQSSGKAAMLGSLYKKMTKKRERRTENSPSASRLLRTTSIHHLECNDYVSRDETTSDSERSGAGPNSQENVSLATSHGSYMVAEAEGPRRSVVALPELVSAEEEFTSGAFQDRRSVSENHLQTSQMTGGTATVSSFEADHRNDDTASVRRKDFDRSTHDTVRHGNKDRLRISMDGILHKVPSGHNLPEYIEKGKLKLGASGLAYGRSMQRSRSLVESLDRYSPLLESISDREPRRVVAEKLKSLEEEDDIGRVLRSRSLTESSFRNSHLIKSSSAREPKRVFERVVSVRENQGLPERKSMKNFGRILSNPEISQHSGLLVSKDVDAYVSTGHGPKLVDTLVDTKADTNAAEPIDSETGDCPKQLPEISYKQDRNGECIDTEQNDTEQNDTATEPSPVSLGTHLEEDFVVPETYEIIEAGEELPPSSGDRDANDEDAEIIIEEQLQNLNGTRSRHVPLDQKDEDEFNYVSDVLRKSGLTAGGADELLWHSSLEQLDVPLDRQLMLDVMSEVLSGIYESSAIARRTTFAPARIRPVPTGSRVLEEVWAKIGWLLGSEQHSSNPLDSVVGRDFARCDDGWMDLRWDMESVGTEVEDLILEELIDEVLLL
ncbi:uncharacterized protein M6B38_208180 [Iris pallida]|uniref:DUF4378 domain-containing protein n=1 Tax=Iris pallida TaxID=29817 RepID=A0AAX6E549_IRIPA|nr:uncharacterized protein M6B38_208180 [Iris pallida]